MLHAPKLTFSPACPFKPWDQSQQTQSHAKRCEGMRETQKREEPVLETWRGHGACSILRNGDGEVVKQLRGAMCKVMGAMCNLRACKSSTSHQHKLF